MINKKNKFEDNWPRLVAKFQRDRKPINLNFKEAVIKHLQVKPSEVFTHHLHSYPGKVFRFIPALLFSLQELCPPDGVCLDPFCGSGTILLESIINPVFKRNVYGVEINPLGRLISKVKTTVLDELNFKKYFRYLKEVRFSSNDEISVPEYGNIEFWFSKKAIYRLGRLRYLIEQLNDDDCTDFFWTCYSSIIRKASMADPFIPPPVKLKIYKYENSLYKYEFLKKFRDEAEDPDVMSLFENKVKTNYERIQSLNRIREIREGEIRAHLIWDDVKNIRIGNLACKGIIIKGNDKPLPSKSIDLVITSPPYITAQKYIRTQKLELLWLGLLSEKELTSLQKRIIGSEFVTSEDVELIEEIGVKSIDSLVQWALTISPSRAATLFKYFQDMQQAMSEINRVLKDYSYAIFVVGNNKVLGKKIDTFKYLIDLGSSLGFEPKIVLKDRIRGRGMITKRHNKGGLIKEEFIIILRKGAG